MISAADREHLDQEGYVMMRALLSRARVEQLSHSLPEGVAGLRKALQWPAVAALANDSGILSVVEDLTGLSLTPVRGLLFDKSPCANWSVGWHQDLALALKEQKEVTGFGPWSIKAGVPHAHAPRELLEQMITLRFHLDSCTEHDGPLRVLPGSHRNGLIPSSEAEAWEREVGVTWIADIGDMLVMRPLLLHASHSASIPTRRRVLHLEYGPTALPGGLEWSKT